MLSHRRVIGLRESLEPHKAFFSDIIKATIFKRKSIIRECNKNQLRALKLAIHLIAEGTIPIKKAVFESIKKSKFMPFIHREFTAREKFDRVKSINKICKIASILNHFLEPLIS